VDELMICVAPYPGEKQEEKFPGKMDVPEEIIRSYLSDRIGVLATAKTTMGPSVKLIEDKASEAGKKVTIQSVLKADAFDCFLRGDMEAHDRIVKAAASELAGKVGTVVLAQASMGHLAGPIEGVLNVPVLTSPGLAMDALVRRVKEG
jgi:hypothetical protein